MSFFNEYFCNQLNLYCCFYRRYICSDIFMILKSIIGTWTKKLDKKVFNIMITVSFLLVMFWLRIVSYAFALYIKRILEVIFITFVY